MVLKEPDQKEAIGENWHTDHSYDMEPAQCSILHCIETPEFGGDTMFASMAAVFEGFSDGLKDTLRGLKAWHSSRHAFGAAARVQDEAANRAPKPTARPTRLVRGESIEVDGVLEATVNVPGTITNGTSPLYFSDFNLSHF